MILRSSNRMSNRPTITRRHPFVIPAKAGIQPRMHWVPVASAGGHSDSPRRLFAGVRILDSRLRGNDVGGTCAFPARPLIVLEALRHLRSETPRRRSRQDIPTFGWGTTIVLSGPRVCRIGSIAVPNFLPHLAREGEAPAEPLSSEGRSSAGASPSRRTSDRSTRRRLRSVP
jgi:hypothetical protein